MAWVMKKSSVSDKQSFIIYDVVFKLYAIAQDVKHAML